MSAVGDKLRERCIDAVMTLVMFLGRVNLRGKMPGRRRTRRRRPVCMVNQGTLVVPRIALLGAVLLRIKASGRFLKVVAALHLIVRAPFLGY